MGAMGAAAAWCQRNGADAERRGARDDPQGESSLNLTDVLLEAADHDVADRGLPLDGDAAWEAADAATREGVARILARVATDRDRPEARETQGNPQPAAPGKVECHPQQRNHGSCERQDQVDRDLVVQRDHRIKRRKKGQRGERRPTKT